MPTVSLAMIVKNEAASIAETIQSAKPMVDEIIVIDTGSTDKTVDIARAAGAQVESFEWCDDFSKARNAALDRCSSDWILALDADERLSGPVAAVKAQLPMPQGPPYLVFALPLIDVTLAGTFIASSEVLRLFPNRPGLRYHGRIHEALLPDDEEVGLKAARIDGIQILHHGYDPAVCEARGKREYTRRLIEKSLEETPDNRLMHYYLARECAASGETETAVRACRRAITLNEGFQNITLHAHRLLFELLRTTEAPREDVLKAVSSALRALPTNADLWFSAAETLGGCGEPGLALDAFEQCHQLLGGAQEDDIVEGSVIRGAPSRLYEQWSHALMMASDAEKAFGVLLMGLNAVQPGQPGWGGLVERAAQLAVDLGDTPQLPNLLLAIAENEQLSSTPLYDFYRKRKATGQEYETELSRLMNAFPYLQSDDRLNALIAS